MKAEHMIAMALRRIPRGPAVTLRALRVCTSPVSGIYPFGNQVTRKKIPGIFLYSPCILYCEVNSWRCCVLGQTPTVNRVRAQPAVASYLLQHRRSRGNFLRRFIIAHSVDTVRHTAWWTWASSVSSGGRSRTRSRAAGHQIRQERTRLKLELLLFLLRRASCQDHQYLSCCYMYVGTTNGDQLNLSEPNELNQVNLWEPKRSPKRNFEFGGNHFA